jgi:hypothetical protein
MQLKPYQTRALDALRTFLDVASASREPMGLPIVRFRASLTHLTAACVSRPAAARLCWARIPSA